MEQVRVLERERERIHAAKRQLLRRAAEAEGSDGMEQVRVLERERERAREIREEAPTAPRYKVSCRPSAGRGRERKTAWDRVGSQRGRMKRPGLQTTPSATRAKGALVSSSACERSRASPPHRPREDGLAHPADASRSNLADCLGSAFEPAAFQTLALRFVTCSSLNNSIAELMYPRSLQA